jgi:hypothetical protein
MLPATLVDTTALWKIIAASAIGGIGVVIAFGLVLIGISRSRETAGGSAAARTGYLALSTLSALFCLAAVAVGIWAMTKKT